MKTLVIVPAHNEAENLPFVTEELRRLWPGDFLIVDDGSTDGTAALCRKMGWPALFLPVNLGLEGAFYTGLVYAVRQGYEAVAQLDGDGQHPAEYLGSLFAGLAEADVAIGSRYTAGGARSLRHFGGSLLGLGLRLTTGCRLTDPTSGFRAYGPRALDWYTRGGDRAPEPDTLAWFLRCGGRVAELPVTMRPRRAGRSYLSPLNSIRYMVNMLASILLIQFFRKKETL